MQNVTNYLLHDLWSLGYETPKDDVIYNGTYDLTNQVYTPKSDQNPTYQIKFQRKFDTGDVYDFLINYVIFQVNLRILTLQLSVHMEIQLMTLAIMEKITTNLLSYS